MARRGRYEDLCGKMISAASVDCRVKAIKNDPKLSDRKKEQRIQFMMALLANKNFAKHFKGSKNLTMWELKREYKQFMRKEVK